MAQLDEIDRKLIRLLRDDGREPVTNLAHALGISRAGVYARLQRLEKSGVILGYTVRLGEPFERSLVKAHVMIKRSPKQTKSVEKALSALPQLVALHAISGSHDLIAVIEAASIGELNRTIDLIGETEGVESTTSSIVLDTIVLRSPALG